MAPARSIPALVKTAIQEVKGEKHPDPTDISLETLLSELEFDKRKIQQLTDKLNEIANRFRPQKLIDKKAVSKCKTVHDCILLVVYNSFNSL